MASTEPATTQAAHDDLDDLFNYDAVGDDVFRGPELSMDAAAPLSPRRPKPIDLGLDEEVQRQNRKPNPKLDEDRLLSQAGLPKLRRIARDKFKFKGKGHEFSDVARLLNLYQLWLDDLYPKAKFADGLAMIEKLGHKRRIQIMRREWTSESRRRHYPGEIQREDSAPKDTVDGPKNHKSATASTATNDGRKPDDALPERDRSLFVSDDEALVGSEPAGDELDELMAEVDAGTGTMAAHDTGQRQNENLVTKDTFDDEYADEMEMMRDMENW